LKLIVLSKELQFLEIPKYQPLGFMGDIILLHKSFRQQQIIYWFHLHSHITYFLSLFETGNSVFFSGIDTIKCHLGCTFFEGLQMNEKKNWIWTWACQDWKSQTQLEFAYKKIKDIFIFFVFKIESIASNSGSHM
jgi:hypothetical protein